MTTEFVGKATTIIREAVLKAIQAYAHILADGDEDKKKDEDEAKFNEDLSG